MTLAALNVVAAAMEEEGEEWLAIVVCDCVFQGLARIQKNNISIVNISKELTNDLYHEKAKRYTDVIQKSRYKARGDLITHQLYA